MKNLIYILLFIGQISFAQSGFLNNGAIQIHDTGSIGFHTNVVNNGIFNQNVGFAGFYNYTQSLSVAGANAMSFKDVEIDVYDDLYLDNSLIITNNLSFITGKVVTPRDEVEVSLDFDNYFLYAGESDDNYVNGYASTINNSEFIFPIGDGNALRPMLLTNQANNSSFTGAYFNEDPNNPSTFNEVFDTSKKQEILGEISKVEFWDLNGTIETQVVLTWDANSNMQALTNDMVSLRVVGWDINTNKWVDLGSENISGNLFNGSVQSSTFIPNNYEIITIGSDFRGIGDGNSCFDIKSFTPNGDGINEYLVIEGIELRPNNTLQIINRWGAVVYSKDGYDNTWNGVSEHGLTINKNKGLPTGTYYYILKLHDDGTTCIGYIYLKR